MSPRREISSERAAVAARLRLALAMQREGTALMRENLRRRHPQANDGELDALLQAWLAGRPPDAPGKSVAWPRRRGRAA